MLANLLLVDADCDRVRDISQSLTDAGASVHAAGDRASALAWARDLQPEVVLIDVAFNGCEGAAVAVQLGVNIGHLSVVLYATSFVRKQ